jgi:acyl carrier protein phosphodiesterase
MAENDAEYTERAKSLNWSAEATPSHTQNIIRGEYRAPLRGLAVEGYAELAVIQEQIAHLSNNIKRFAGTEEQYYIMVNALDSLKENFNIKYDELIK